MSNRSKPDPNAPLRPYNPDDVKAAPDATLLRWLRSRYSAQVYAAVHAEARRRNLV